MELNTHVLPLSDAAARWTLLSLMILIPLPTRASAKKDPYSSRRGDLMITATRVEIPETAYDGTRPLHARRGYHFVVVDVQVRNLGRRAQCAYLSAVLQASFGIESHRLMFGRKPPDIQQLLPGEETAGSYTFEVKDGVAPLALILTPAGGQGCGSHDLLSPEPGVYFGPLKLHLPPPESTAPIPGKEH